MLSTIAAWNSAGHLHGQHEDRERDRGEHADNEGIHVKKFLVPTQLTAPELELKSFSRTERPAEAGNYITTKRPKGQHEN
jgi:hypothetical protein